MIEYWRSLTNATKFSIIGFIISLTLGFLSMGFLGLALYYSVSFLFNSYPSLNDWAGDWVWPAFIGVGMAWSIGFVMGGLAWHFLSKFIHFVFLKRLIYGLILWIWAAILWYIVIKNNLDVM